MEKPYEKKVKDIMIPIYDYPTVSAEATLKDSIQVLRRAFQPQDNKPRTGRQHILIVDNNELVGTFGVPDLLKAVEPQYLKSHTFYNMQLTGSWAIPIFWDGLFSERCREIANKKIKDFMQPLVYYVKSNDTILKASYSMAKYKTNLVPVKENDKLVGIIRSIDVFQEISNWVIYGDMLLETQDISNEPWLKEMALEV